MLFGQLHLLQFLSLWNVCILDFCRLYLCIHSSFIGLTLMERHQFHTAMIQTFKVLHSLCPAYLRDWFVYAEAYTGRCGHNKHRLYIPQIQTRVKWIFYRGAVTWNNLPLVLYETKTLSHFKSVFKLELGNWTEYHNRLLSSL